MTILDHKPAPGDYAPFYKGYIDAVETDDITSFLAMQQEEMLRILKETVWEKWELAYAQDKWTLAELVLHMIDAERIFAYRALRIARGDQTPIPGFEHNDYVPNSAAGARTPASIVDEFAAVRGATLHLFKNFTEDMWDRRGVASGAEVTVSALAYMIAGHTAHHLKVIQERYL